MKTSWRERMDHWLGRGRAAITVPVMDGALKPNRRLDESEVAAHLPGLDDLASDGHTLWLSAGPVLYRWSNGAALEVQHFDAEITALAAAPPGAVAVALAGRRIVLIESEHNGTLQERAHLGAPGGQALCSINAMAFDALGRIVFSAGSDMHSCTHWCHDLMELGHTGRVMRWNPDSDTVELLASGLRYAFGVLPLADGVFYSESWAHQVATSGPSRALLSDLPAYPSRMSPAADGGFWLSCFVCRTQLVEFVLREPAYRQRMLREVDPRYWIAPALASGQSFLEPLQGAGVKQMGLLKPWAPPRSYGLVLRVASDGRVLYSLHSQVDGMHHGITAVLEHAGSFWAVSKGSARLLRIPLGKLGDAA